ncbi:hypothetical protein GJ744_012455 [Endocarpon pusillum]|uniref:Uncharacterized protein n=1 Tax=Endocarpon pusillum TaxID=364733 RepID=A0A8H7AB59_9EURO|nr:hypothetical protein GJ744_012455 [Endocarpon pusillum]
MDDEPVVTILLLGNANCGKSTFLSRLASSQPPHRLLPDTAQPIPLTTTLYNRSYRLEFSDTACPHRHYSLLDPDVVVLCYDISDRQSLQDAQHRWRKEV